MKIIPTTRPSLPELSEFIPYLEDLWESKQLTNNGKFHQCLERELSKYLGVKHISIFNNATTALLVAIKTLNLEGEIITTPYSFVATTHAITWSGITPVFSDIDPSTFNIDPKLIESKITNKTTAIMPVHCYGFPCDVELIEKIAKKHHLKVIYDAAHAFGVEYKHSSILNNGDLSVISFHATKTFNTFEGGAIICRNNKIKERIDNIRNFGIVNETTITDIGINGKMSEIHAAFGLLQLKKIDENLSKREMIDAIYRSELAKVVGISIPEKPSTANSNFSYFPVIIGNNYPLTRDALHLKLNENGILSRRYFFPLISDMPMYKNSPSASPSDLPHAHSVSNQILCLPLYSDLQHNEVYKIIKVISEGEV